MTIMGEEELDGMVEYRGNPVKIEVADEEDTKEIAQAQKENRTPKIPERKEMKGLVKDKWLGKIRTNVAKARELEDS